MNKSNVFEWACPCFVDLFWAKSMFELLYPKQIKASVTVVS